jgi:hypothetical protein
MTSAWNPSAVYFLTSDAERIRIALLTNHPPGSETWGWNVSTWKPGYHYVLAQSEVDLLGIARAAAHDPETVISVPLKDVTANEAGQTPSARRSP